jgi:hypothetical protein
LPPCSPAAPSPPRRRPPTLPPAPAATTITPGGATATTVTPVSGATQVSTSTISGGNAYNQFSTFQIAPGDTVDLIVPTAATNNNLLNLVTGSATQIYGTLNSLLQADGKIGGNIFFADPSGIIVGASGVVNVGSLTFATPSTSFVNNFFNDIPGNTATLLAGTEPLSSDGLIAVLGQVNSAGPATLTAPTVAVTGGMTTGAAQFGSLVNTAGLQSGQSISINGSSITIDGGLYGGTAPASLNAGTGDIALTANASDTEAIANAVASITLGAANLAGDNVTAEATAAATSNDSISNTVTQALTDTSSLPWNILDNLAAWNTTSSNAAVNLGAGSGVTTINAQGNVTLGAGATSTTSINTVEPLIGLNYGVADATSTADLGANAHVTAGGAFTLSTLNQDSLSMTPSSAGSSTPAVMVAYGKATVNSTTTLAGSVQAASVGVTADNENSFYINASDSAGGGGPAGVGVAIGDFASQANAILSGSATATGADLVSGSTTTPAFNLAATSNNTVDSVAAASETTNDSTLTTITNAATGGVPFLGDLTNYISGLGTSKVNSQDQSSALGIAAAVGYSSSTNAANATASGTAAASAGTAGIASSATDEPQVGAGGTAGDATASIGGGVTIGNFNNTADTTVNGSVTGDQGVNINATATLPNPFNLSVFTAIPGEFSNFQFVAPSSITDTNAYQKDWNAAQTLGGDLVTVLNPKNTSGIGQFLNSNLGIGNLVNTFVETGASGKSSNGGSGFGLAASVDILGITNQATTDVAHGADVTANNNGVNVNANSNAFLINVAGMAFDLGQLKDKNPGASGDAALGGTYLGLNLTNSAIASIDDGAQVTAQNGGAVNVGGTTNETLIDIAQAGDNAGKFGINGTFNWVTLNNTAEGYIQSNAVVDAAGAVNVNGTNTLNAFTIGGALGYGGSAEIGATVAWNQLTNNTLAYIGDPGDARTSSTGSVTAGSGGVNLNANTNDTLWNISLAAELATGQKQDTSGSGNTSEGGGSGSGGSGGSGSFGLGISGNVAINDITDTTQAYINNAANIYTPGTVGVAAQDTSFAVSGGLAFALAASGDGTGITLGGAFARNDFTKTTESWIDNALVAGVLNAQTNQHDPAGSLNLSANSTGNLLTISAGASISTGDGVGIAGSANNNVLTNTTEAGLGTGANVDVSGAADIAATQHDRALAIAGALSYAGNVGLGAALDYSNYTNTTKAYIGDGAALTAGGDISVTASTEEQLLPIIASLGASDNVGLAGAASKDEIQNDTEATIGAAQVNTDSSLVLGADDNSQLLLIVGSLGGAGDVGVGVSGAISIQSQPLLERTVKATIAQGAEVQTGANAPVSYQNQDYLGLLADATAEGGADTIVAGVGGAGDVGIAASLALNYFTEDVEATVDGSINPADAAANTHLGHQNVTVNANDSAQILDVAGNIAASGAVSVGAAADVQFLTRTVKAEIGGNVQSNANIAATATQGGSDWSVAGAGSFSGSVNIAGSASALFDTSTVTANIAPGATVYTPGSINVAAARTENINTIDGELGISGDAGIGASLSLLEQNDTTTADVGANANVTALGEIPIAALVNVGNDAQNSQLYGLAVTANANDTLLTIAAGGQASLGVSLAGSVVLNDVADTTNAYVDSGAVINPASGPAGAPQQAVDILAHDGTNLTSGAGALAVGLNIYGVGVGAAVNLEGAVAQLPSAASSFQSTLTGDLGGVSDNAASNIPGGFSKNTSAGVNNGASVNAAGALTIAALSSETLNNYDAAIGGGIAGLAGSVELDDYTPTTTAYFGQCVSAIACSGSSGAGADVGSASVKANDTLNYFSVVGAAEAGGGALGAAVLDATVAAQTSAYVGAYSSLTANKGVAINSTFTDNYSAAVLAGGIGGIVANVPYATITDQSDNSAFIAADATVAGGGGPVSVNAITQRTISAVSGAAVAGGLGVGATILDANFYGATAADIAPGATVSSGNAIRVLAQLDDSVPQYLNLPSDVTSALSKIPGLNGNQIPTGILGATVAGLAGIGGQVTITDNARDTAFVAATSLTAGDGISVTADDEPNLWAQSAAAEAGLVGAGASISDINLGGAVSATFNTDATATQGSIQVASTLAETLNGDATGIGGGLATGNGTVVNINDATTNSVFQSGTATASAGDASFIAGTNRNAYANAGSTNVGLLAVGISFADVNLDGATSATLNGDVTASSSSGTATLKASSTDYANVDAIVDAKGGANGIGALAGSPNGLGASPSRIDPGVTVNVGSGAKVNANTVNILANDQSTLDSTANGGGTGVVNVGLLDAEGTVAPSLMLNMDGALTGGVITVQNTGNQSVTSNAQSPLSTSLLSLYSTSDGANSNPDVHLNFNGSANGTGNVTIESDSNSTVSATANADQNYDTIANDPLSQITILAGGLTTSNAGINNTNVATAYGTIASAQGNAALNAVSVNQVTQNDATGGTGSGVAEGGLVYATTKVYDTTHANLDAALDALAGTASVLASETDNATSDAYISSSGWSGIDYVQANGYTGVNASPIVNVDGGANIQANAIDITATLPEMMSGANATAQAQKGFAGDGYAYSDFEGIFNPTIEVHGGAQLTAPTIDILANVGNPTIPVFNGILGASDATAGTQSATGTASANATNNATLFPGTKLDSGSTLTTNNLKVQAIYPLVPLFGSTPSVSGVSTVTWVAEQVQEVVNEVVGWIPFVGNLIDQVVQTVTKWVEQITNSNVYANSYGTFEPGSAITVDSTIQQLGSSNGATLTIGANGQPTTADGLSIQNEDNNSILVNSLINNSNPLQITLDATGGTVGGTPTIIENNMPPFVNITNDSNLNLILQQLSPIGGSGGNPPISITADDASQFNPNFVENQTPTAITIANNGSGDVLFTNVIADQPGSITVNNLGGNILGTVNSQLDANQLAFDAPHGSIGSNAGTIYACPLCPVTSQNGDVVLGPLTLQPDEVALAANSAPVVPSVSAVAVGDINLNLKPSEPVANGIASGAPSVDLTNILAGGDANITLNPATVSGVELVPVTINFFGIPVTFNIPEPVNGPAPNTDYNVGAGQWLAAGGDLNLGFGGAQGSQVTLNDNGLVASGFEGINFALGPFDNPISNVVADNQTNYSLLNYLQSISGPQVLSNINASSGGHVVFAGGGAVAGNGTIAVLDGQSNASFIDLFNLATPTVQSILDPGVNTSSISIFGNNQPLSGTLAGSGVSLGSYGVPGGEIALQSSTGLNVAGTLLAPLGVIQAVSQGDLNALSGVINGGTLVNLTSNSGSLLLGPINVPAGNLIATASGDIFDPTLITAGNATLNAKGGSITLQQATVGHIANLIAAQDITSGAITAGGAANLNAQNGSITLNQSLAANGITAAAGQDITSQGTLLSLGDATLNAARGSIDGNGPIAIQGNASLTAGGNITLQALTAGQSALLRALAGDINLGNLAVSNGPAQLLAGGNINAANGNIQASTDALLTANGDINLGTLKAGNDAVLTAGGSIHAANGTIAAGTDADLQAKTGDIQLGVLSAGNDANLSSGGSIDAGAGVVQAGNTATLNAGDAITLGQLAAGQNASLTTVGGDINLGSLTAAAGTATLTAGGNINAASGTVTAGTDATLTAADAITLGTVLAGQNAALTTASGDISLGSVTATAGNATLTSGGSIDATNGTVSAGNDATLAAAGAITLGSVAAGDDAGLSAGSVINLGTVAAGHDATLTAGATINAANGSVTAGNNATLTAADNIVLGTVTATAGNAQITAQNGFLAFGAITAGQDATLTAGQDMNAATGTVSAGHDASLTAGGSINALGLQVTAGHDANLAATTGSINTGNAAITAGNDANLTAAQNITLGRVRSGQNATLSAQTGDITLGSVTATAGDATLTAGHDINAGTGSVTAGTDAALTAGQDITLGTVLAGQNATLAAQAGSISLGSVTATVGDATLTAGDSIYAANGTVAAGHDATLTAQAGDVDLGTVTAGNNATATANDSINIGAAGSVTAGSTAALTTFVNDINLLGTVTAPTAVLTANRNISGGGTVIAGVTQLAAETGAIGATGDDLNVEMNTIGGVTPTLSAAARNDINLNLTAIDPPGPAGSAADATEPTGGQPTLFAELVSLIAGGNLNLNLNPGLASGTQENAWYEIPQGALGIAAGNVAVNEAAPTGDYAAVTLDVDGLLASGFQSLNYTISPSGAWSTTVGIAGHTATGPINFGTIANGIINLSDINAAQGGQIAITGTGQLGNARNLVTFTGMPTVTVDNQDPNLTLQANDITLGFIQGGVQWARPSHGSGIRFVEGGFGGHEFGGGQPGGKDDHGKGDDEHNNGNEVHGPNAANNQQNNPDGWGQSGDGGQNGPTLTLDSAGGVVLAGHISNPDGTTSVSGAAGISGTGLTESQVLNLASLDGAIGSAAAPLAVGIAGGGQLNAAAAGDIAIIAPAGNLPLGTIATPGDIYLATPAGSLWNALPGGEEDGRGWGDGDPDQPSALNLSGHNITLTASGSIGDEGRPVFGTASGLWTLSAGDDLNLTSGANMNVASLTAEDANLNVTLAGGELNIASASIADSLNAQADNIAIAALNHADPVNPLNLLLTGSDGRMAQSINVAVTSVAPVLVRNYSSQTGGVSLAGDWLYVDHASIGQSASFQNSWLNVALANTDKRGHAEDATLDMVGNLLNAHADHDLNSSVTQLQPGLTFALPSKLTPTQEWMVDGLHLGHDFDGGRH